MDKNDLIVITLVVILFIVMGICATVIRYEMEQQDTRNILNFIDSLDSEEG